MAEPPGHIPTQVDSLSALVGLLRRGERVYLPGSGGEPLGLLPALAAGGVPLAQAMDTLHLPLAGLAHPVHLCPPSRPVAQLLLSIHEVQLVL